MVLPAPSFYPGRLASENVAGAVSIYLKANNIVVIVRVGGWRKLCRKSRRAAPAYCGSRGVPGHTSQILEQNYQHEEAVGDRLSDYYALIWL